MPNRVRQGFVLLEAVVALLVIGLATAGALELFSAHLRAAARQPALVTAAALAQDRMAAVRLLPPAEMRRLADSLARGQFAAPFAGYRWRASTSRARNDNLYDIRVDVSWAGGSYTLATSASAPPEQSVRR
jgi:type II secretory pathway pseudopilin PulG